MGQERDPPVGKGRKEKFGLRTGYIEDEIFMVCFAPIVFGAVAGLQRESNIFIDGPFAAGFCEVQNLMAEIPAVVRSDCDGGEVPSKTEIDARDELRDRRIGKECVCVEIACEKRRGTGAILCKKEIAESDFDLLDFLIPVLNGKNVMVVGSYCRTGQGFIFKIGFDQVFIVRIGPDSLQVRPRSIAKKSKSFSFMGGTGSVKQRQASQMGCESHRAEMEGSI